MDSIYINFKDIETPMVHVKFQDHGTSKWFQNDHLAIWSLAVSFSLQMTL